MLTFPTKAQYSVVDLIKLVELLRSPDGCPWDQEQTHESHRRDLLEEAYEVAEAIDDRDAAHLKEELGDLLLAVVFHAQIELEGKGFGDGFTLDDVADSTVRKLIYRHPHVFGDVAAETSAEVLSNWDTLKQAERGEQTLADSLNHVARSLPALWRSEKIVKKIRKSGGTLDGLDYSSDEERIGGELLAIVASAHERGIDPERALHNACERVIAKFS
jgi:tetrapyrrole methylase family protein/MazG family protein